MRIAIIATVGLLLLSLAAFPPPAGGDEPDPAVDETRAGHVEGGGTALVATGPGVGAADGAPRERLLALPGVDSVGVPLLVALGGLLALLIVGAALLSRRSDWSGDDRRPPSAWTDSASGDDASATGPPATDRATGGERPTVRTDEEYVVQLLIANHGRMRQARIVEETDWSKAKVSRLLSRMEERDQVVRERAGREKVVQLADANSSIPL